MRRWFLSRFYRLGLGGWFGPPTRYVDKAPVPSSPVADVVLPSSPAGDTILKTEVDP